MLKPLQWPPRSVQSNQRGSWATRDLWLILGPSHEEMASSFFPCHDQAPKISCDWALDRQARFFLRCKGKIFSFLKEPLIFEQSF